VAWEISLHEDVERWYLGLCRDDPQTADGIADAIEQLAAVGPALGRPLVDRIHGSRHHNMKELRPPSTGTSEVRLLFAFDPEREAVILVAGDKSGRWETWYRQAIPLADQRFDEHLDVLKHETTKGRQPKEGR
jgi:hypothetical protein